MKKGKRGRKKARINRPTNTSIAILSDKVAEPQSKELVVVEKKREKCLVLPPEVWYVICHMAGHREKLSASLTCKQFRDFVY